MGLFIWVSSCIGILSLLSYLIFASFLEQETMIRYLAKHVEEASEHTFDTIVIHARESYHKKTNELIPPPQKGFRLTSKLHISPTTFTSLGSQLGSSSLGPAEHILYNLLTTLYPGIGNTIKKGEKDPEALALLLTALSTTFTRLEGKYSTTASKVLANFELDNEKTQYCLWVMLNGRTLPSSTWDPLLPYISFQKKPFLTSLWLAPVSLLKAIVETDDKVKDIVEARNTLYKQLRKSKKLDDTAEIHKISNEFHALCEQKLPDWLPHTLVDMNVSSTPPPH